MLNRLTSLFRSKSISCRVGLFIQPEMLELCVLSDDGSQLLAHARQPVGIDQLTSQLKTWVSEYNLRGAPVQVSLGNSWYEFQQTERPNVPEPELNQALSWSVRELVQIPQANLLVDYFDLPAQPAGGNKVNVVCADREQILPIVDAVQAADLKLISISVEELALASLMQTGEEAELLLFQNRGDDLLLAIIKQGKLFFVRRLRGYAGLPDYSESDMAQGAVDNLSLEIQRSMDLFESQLRQAPVRAIRLAIDSPHQQQLAELISANFFQPVSAFHCPLVDPSEQTTSLLPAVGAAMSAQEAA